MDHLLEVVCSDCEVVCSDCKVVQEVVVGVTVDAVDECLLPDWLKLD